MKFRHKTVLGVACIEAVLVSLLIWNSISFLRSSNQEQLVKRAETTAQLLATMCTNPVLSMDLATLKSQVDLLTHDDSLKYVRVLSATRGVLVERGETGKLNSDRFDVALVEANLEDGVADAKADIMEGGVRYGWVEVGLTDTGIATLLNMAKHQAFMTAGVCMVISALFSLALGIYLTRQLDGLVRASNLISTGRFDSRIPVKGKDELARVAQAFNKMCVELSAAISQMEERIHKRTQELAYTNERLQGEISERLRAHRDISQILNAISVVLIGVDSNGLVFRWSKAASLAFQIDANKVEGKFFASLPLPWDFEAIMRCIETSKRSAQSAKANNIWYERTDGTDGFLVISVTPLYDEMGQPSGFLLLADDITEVKSLEVQLSHAAKLEAVGHLAAGIAHEINTPTQFVGDSVTFLKDAFSDIAKLVSSAEFFSRHPDVTAAEMSRVLTVLLEEIDAEFLKVEIPMTFDRIFDGIQRISSIVQAMKRFSHSGGQGMQTVNIHNAIESTVTISRNEWKYVSTVKTEFDPELAEIICIPGEINQVLLNVIVNAAHAIGDVVSGTSNMGIITIKTRKDGNFAEISIQDTGSGIPDHAKDKVFDLFFTTKEVGKGTGQGLAIAHDIIVNKHKGAITFQSEIGKGTTFIIRLPIRG